MSDIVVFDEDNLNLEVRVDPGKDTVWLTLDEMAKLFDKNRSTIGEHVRNIFKEGELEESTSGGISPRTANLKSRPPKIYNLDVIISVGYRVKSKRGLSFRKWASNILKQYLIQGYAIDQKKLVAMQKVFEIQDMLKDSVKGKDASEILDVIQRYSKALDLLDDYDHQCIKQPKTNIEEIYQLSYNECREIIDNMKFSSESDLFGLERDKGALESTILTIYQAFDGQEFYSTFEAKAANLLYLLAKNHTCIDGNKRIAAAIFLHFMHKNQALFKENGNKRISDDALVAVTIMIAESKPDEKDIMTSLVMNFITE